MSATLYFIFKNYRLKASQICEIESTKNRINSHSILKSKFKAIHLQRV